MGNKIEDEFDFVLGRKIPYATKDGETVDGSFIKLVSPSAKQLKYCTELKQAFMRSMSDTGSNYTPEQIEDAKRIVKDSGKTMSGSDIINALYGNKDVDMVKVLINAIELFRSGVATMEGEVNLTKPLIDAMSQDDLENMTGEYMVNFILRSVLKNMS